MFLQSSLFSPKFPSFADGRLAMARRRRPCLNLTWWAFLVTVTDCFWRFMQRKPCSCGMLYLRHERFISVFQSCR